MIWFQINLEFILVYVIRIGSKFIFIPNGYAVDPISPLCPNHTRYSLPDFHVCMLLDFLSYSIDLCLFMCQCHTVLLTSRSYSNFIFYRRINRDLEGQVSFPKSGSGTVRAGNWFSWPTIRFFPFSMLCCSHLSLPLTLVGMENLVTMKSLLCLERKSHGVMVFLGQVYRKRQMSFGRM